MKFRVTVYAQGDGMDPVELGEFVVEAGDREAARDVGEREAETRFHFGYEVDEEDDDPDEEDEEVAAADEALDICAECNAPYGGHYIGCSHLPGLRLPQMGAR